MHRVLAILVVFFAVGFGALAHASPECHQHMQVTGYYIPQLKDFDAGMTRQVSVDGTLRTFNASFLEQVFIKEKGITLSGEVLLLEEGEWTIDEIYLADAEKKWFPNEHDYVTMRTITSLENKKTREYPKAFVDASGEQGWGQVAKGEYIGKPLDCVPRDGAEAYLSAQCNDQWHFSTKPLNASGGRLEIGVVATDKMYFNSRYPWKVTIDPRPAGFSSNIFEARDTGVASSVNVFCGSGLEGLKCAMRVTTNGSKVCFTKTSQD